MTTRRSFVLTLALASALGCSSTPAGTGDDGPPPKKADCDCAARMEECDCPHCASMGEGFAPGACPCAKRGYR